MLHTIINLFERLTVMLLFLGAVSVFTAGVAKAQDWQEAYDFTIKRIKSGDEQMVEAASTLKWLPTDKHKDAVIDPTGDQSVLAVLLEVLEQDRLYVDDARLVAARKAYNNAEKEYSFAYTYAGNGIKQYKNAGDLYVLAAVSLVRQGKVQNALNLLKIAKEKPLEYVDPEALQKVIAAVGTADILAAFDSVIATLVENQKPLNQQLAEILGINLEIIPTKAIITDIELPYKIAQAGLFTLFILIMMI
jgi:hypothetical protein